MSELKPPTRFVRIMCYFIGAGVFAPALWKNFGKPGLALGILVGTLVGHGLGRWVEHTFLEF